MNKEQYAKYINMCLANGADFAEIYEEKTTDITYTLSDEKLDTIGSSCLVGLGIRVIKDGETFYISTNNMSEKNIEKAILKLTKGFEKREIEPITLDDLEDKRIAVEIPHDAYPIDDKKKILYRIDKVARETSDLISQVKILLFERDTDFTIANSKGKFVASNQCLTRLMINVFASKNGNLESANKRFGYRQGYEFLKDLNLDEISKEVAQKAVAKLDAIYFKGGEMPAVICNGFGAVIFHEACGHGLEATAVAPHSSVFSDDLDNKIASEKVTLIDDGTIEGAWGTNSIDDEGAIPQKNILIENGILKQYLVDGANAEKMGQSANGCARRENYRYAPTSRMSNTYLAPGNDSIDDMIKSIDYGIYCEEMGGGSVRPATGDFNFTVAGARLIEHGKLTKYLKGCTLIGNSKDILKNVEMVSDDLNMDSGICGSASGHIPVTIGQPTIKVSKILVGGKE